MASIDLRIWVAPCRSRVCSTAIRSSRVSWPTGLPVSWIARVIIASITETRSPPMYSSGAMAPGSVVGSSESSTARACCIALRSTLMQSAAMIRPAGLRK
ncbi:hypothetical protein CGZ93_01130 [Enemella dayhoffiae]|uniref:Uncharacterized protein n=1 Tax=Enemella dayhoffiae TaxID=2016507 RepID=A0A255HFD1_9ACTN|nr:hypothetical protein CGZ93_01130 [Enemella dayhoffiae]